MCTFAARHAVGKRPPHYNTRKISPNLVCSLVFLHEALPKCRENYGDSLSAIYGIYDVIAKILVVSTIYVYTMNITMTYSSVHIKLGLI